MIENQFKPTLNSTYIRIIGMGSRTMEGEKFERGEEGPCGVVEGHPSMQHACAETCPTLGRHSQEVSKVVNKFEFNSVNNSIVIVSFNFYRSIIEIYLIIKIIY